MSDTESEEPIGHVLGTGTWRDLLLRIPRPVLAIGAQQLYRVLIHPAATLITTTARTLTCMRRRALLVFLAIATGCQFSENRYLARAVKAEELVGSWRSTDFAIKSLRDVGVTNHLTVEDHTLLLSADGSCSIRTFMKISGSDTADYRTYDSGCRWRLGDAGHQALQFDLTPVPPGGSPYYYFDEKDGRLLLWQYATDPDAWRYMEFEKRTP